MGPESGTGTETGTQPTGSFLLSTRILHSKEPAVVGPHLGVYYNSNQPFEIHRESESGPWVLNPELGLKQGLSQHTPAISLTGKWNLN
jgi:hypothetical protein